MKKQAKNNGHESAFLNHSKDTFSRVLLVCAIFLYSLSLVLLANLALADNLTETKGALIKVNNQLDGNAFANAAAEVKSYNGNILSVNISADRFATLKNVKGVCDAHMDVVISNTPSSHKNQEAVAKYAGADVVVGILDNSGFMSPAAMQELKKVESAANIGFISYVANANSTVIIRNLRGGESNMVQALAYMKEYAKTVNKPLVIEMVLSGSELQNPLFVQVCQKMAEGGIQFVGVDLPLMFSTANSPIQLAFSTFNSETGKITDQSDFWAIQEVKEQQLMLLGSDENTCSIYFQTEAGFDKVYISNVSSDIVLLTALSANGEVNYYHVTNGETALIPRVLANGTPYLEDGLAGVYPFYSKKAVFNGTVADNQFVALNANQQSVNLNANSKMNLSVGSSSSKTLSMSLSNLDDELAIEIKDIYGNTVYMNQPDAETQSIQTKIDLSEGAEGLYFLDLTSPKFHQSVALMID